MVKIRSWGLLAMATKSKLEQLHFCYGSPSDNFSLGGVLADGLAKEMSLTLKMQTFPLCNTGICSVDLTLCSATNSKSNAFFIMY